MNIHKKIGSKDRLFEMFENVNKIKLNESFDKTLSVKDWNEFSDGSIELTFSDNRIESFNYYDEEDTGGALDYHASGQGNDNVAELIYINDDNTLLAKFEATSLTNNPDNPEWEINNILEVEPFQQQTNESTSQSYSDQTGIKRAIMLDNEFSQLVDPYRTAFIADPKTKIFSTGTALVFTDGKREFVVSKNRPMNVLKGVSNARAIIKDLYNNSLESPEPLKEDVNNEVGTDSGIFQMILVYVTKNRITEEEFQVGELTVQIVANPTTWDESPHMAATHMQPEEGGYPENVQGEISDIVIWDREDNEYSLSSDALQRLNQNVNFDGNVLEDITQKAINGGSDDEYGRADFAHKDNLENESVIKEDNSSFEDIKYHRNERGYWIPIGYEDKKVGLGPAEGNGDWTPVNLGMFMDDDDRFHIIKTYPTWDEARKALYDSIT